jgi:hypothetical protein
VCVPTRHKIAVDLVCCEPLARETSNGLGAVLVRVGVNAGVLANVLPAWPMHNQCVASP